MPLLPDSGYEAPLSQSLSTIELLMRCCSLKNACPSEGEASHAKAKTEPAWRDRESRVPDKILDVENRNIRESVGEATWTFDHPFQIKSQSGKQAIKQFTSQLSEEQACI